MNLLIIGLIIFLGSHLLLRAPFIGAIKAKIGAMPFKGLFSLIALAGFIIMIVGYAGFRPNAPELYAPPSWGKHVNYLLTLIAMILFVASYMKGKISDTLRHPQLNAVKFWAFGHLLSNGDLASFILFASFLGWAIISRILQPKTPRQNLVWCRNDEGAIAFGILLWVTFAFKLHALWFGANPFGG